MKAREFWIATEWQHEDGCKDLIAVTDPDQLNTISNSIHVIEKSAYDQLLEQANKLAAFLLEEEFYLTQGSVGTEEEYKRLIFDWQEFKKAQGIDK
jgi:hypothetical protein